MVCSQPSGRAGVAAQKATEALVLDDVAGPGARRAKDDVVPDALVWPLAVVVVDEGRQHVLEMPCSLSVLAIVDRATRWPTFFTSPWIRH